MPDSVSGIHASLRTGRSGVQIPVGARNIYFSKRPNKFHGPPILLFNGYRGSFPAVKRQRRRMPRLSMCGAVPPFPLCVIMEWAWKTFPFINIQLQTEFNFSVGPKTNTDCIPAVASNWHTKSVGHFTACRVTKHACCAAFTFTVLDFQGLLKRTRNVHRIIRCVRGKEGVILTR